MAKLRKMLGKPDSPCAVALMRLIETQSQQTLIRWAVEYTARRCLPIFAKQLAEDTRPSDALNSCRAYLSGELRLAEVKPFLKAARQAAQDADQFPAAQAAARAIATACAVVQNPPGALGFTFYCAAAVAYDEAGVDQPAAVYDQLAEKEFEEILRSLQQAALSDEPNPVKIDWNC
ncbi:MAG TPA: hypothetical protein IAC40_08085 [Candidatus Faecivivens stercorigallinarum]|nr:hypothetical protein [Candidatus Faecivivens stercorigallinarum]